MTEVSSTGQKRVATNDGKISILQGENQIKVQSRTTAVSADNPADIQLSIDSLIKTGGTVTLTGETFTLASDIILRSGVRLQGQKESKTILDFNSTAHSIKFEDSTVYSTGTITSISMGVVVTGSGTSWSTNVTAGQHLFLQNRHYKIASVDSDTQLTLSEGYINNASLPGASYRISTILVDVELSELTVINSTDDGLKINGGRRILIDNCTFQANNVGVDFDYVTEVKGEVMTVVANASDGVQFTNCGYFYMNSAPSAGNGGHGYILNNCETLPLTFTGADANAGDGINATDCTKCLFNVEASGNGGYGIQFVSGCTLNYIERSLLIGNTSDGVKLTETSDNNIIVNNIFNANGAYGINIADSTDDSNLLANNQYLNSITGDYSDSGTDTIIIDGSSPVDSVNGQTGIVVLDPDDLDDTSTTNKFVTATDITNLGNLSGTNTGDQTSVSGNAGTATKLATARNIAGVAFDGSADIDIGIDGLSDVDTSTTPPTDTQVLTWNDTDSKWEPADASGGGSGISAVVDDTTPQLGGDLDTNGHNIGFDDNGAITDDSGNEQIVFHKSASAVNHLAVDNGATGFAPALSAEGDDTNINIFMRGKGSGSIIMADGDTNNVLVAEGNGSTPVNYLAIHNADTTVAPYLEATGSDTNVDLNLKTKGSGAVQANGNDIYFAGGTDVPVTDGGTGRSSHTAYAVLAGGTTSTGAQQSVSGVGTSGQVLTSNGDSALPSWQDASGGGGSGLTWTEVTGTSQSAAVNNGYITNNAGLVTVTIPTTAPVGSIVRVAGKGAGGWKIAQNTSEVIHYGSVDTTTGTGGSLASSDTNDAVELLCIVDDTEWMVLSSQGNITVV